MHLARSCWKEQHCLKPFPGFLLCFPLPGIAFSRGTAGGLFPWRSCRPQVERCGISKLFSELSLLCLVSFFFFPPALLLKMVLSHHNSLHTAVLRAEVLVLGWDTLPGLIWNLALPVTCDLGGQEPILGRRLGDFAPPGKKEAGGGFPPVNLLGREGTWEDGCLFVVRLHTSDPAAALPCNSGLKRERSLHLSEE